MQHETFPYEKGLVIGPIVGASQQITSGVLQKLPAGFA